MILYGKPIAEKIYAHIKNDLKKIKDSLAMSAILVGEDPASLMYVKAKEKRAAKLGIDFKLYHFPVITGENKILELIEKLNKKSHIKGIIIQLPLPENIDTDKILKALLPEKDLDGFSGKYSPPTGQAILEIFKFYNIETKAKKIVIVGFGRLVGKPLARLLEKKKIKPIICTSSSDIASETLDADIIISATGTPGLIKPEMVSKKAIIIDAGTAESRGKIRGDVDTKIYEKVASYTPTPGGVGPVTVACLMRNLVEAKKLA
jgi:methylenetetrahydrofolate dehydrogenase (NADP+)/methenyltetrahydrofolate cyclohydrolase